MVIVVVLFLLVGFVQGKEVDVNIPEEVKLNEEFFVEVVLKEFPESEYDLKVDILKDSERVSQILDEGKWKSSFFYVKNVFEDKEGKVKMRIIKEFEGSANVLISVRKSGSSSVNKFEDYEIKLGKEEVELKEEELDEDIEEKVKEDIKYENETKIENPESIVIKLSSEQQNINSDEKVIFESKNYLISKYAIYGFAVLCVFIIGLLLIERKKERRYEEV